MSTTADKAEVLATNQRFYDAFATRNLEEMEALWSRGVSVACVHPGWAPLRDREQVMASWAGILGSSGSPQISCARATAHVLGDSAFVVCEELVETSRLVATNVFVREGDGWKLVHHHASPIAHEVSVQLIDDEDEDGEDDLSEDDGQSDKLN